MAINMNAVNNQLIAHTLTNDNGMQVTVANFGARIVSIKIPVDGSLEEMLVTHQEADNFIDDEYYLGATCGRVSNRISGAKFSLDNTCYHLQKNDGDNCSHSGFDSVSNRFWQVDNENAQNNVVKYSLTCPDMKTGFPGDLSIIVEYVLFDDNRLQINYVAMTNKATPINLTNHAYFSLGAQSAHELNVQINADNYLPKTSDNLPTGEVKSVSNSDFDLRELQNIGTLEASASDVTLANGLGYDHCFIVNDNTKPVATLINPQNNMSLQVSSDQAAIQLYTGKYLQGSFTPFQGACLEAQGYVNAINQTDFPSSVLEPGDTYKKTIEYLFF